jgi:hypothetical protein
VSGADVHVPPCQLLQQHRQQQQRQQQQQPGLPLLAGNCLDEAEADAAAAYARSSSRRAASKWDQQQLVQGQRNVSPKRTRTTSATAGRAAGRAGPQPAGVNRQQSSNGGWKPAGAAAIAAAAAAPGSFRQLQSRLVAGEGTAAGSTAYS